MICVRALVESAVSYQTLLRLSAYLISIQSSVRQHGELYKPHPTDLTLVRVHMA